jgi:hypothetical protein
MAEPRLEAARVERIDRGVADVADTRLVRSRVSE